jgi:hypothetical protein
MGEAERSDWTPTAVKAREAKRRANDSRETLFERDIARSQPHQLDQGYAPAEPLPEQEQVAVVAEAFRFSPPPGRARLAARVALLAARAYGAAALLALALGALVLLFQSYAPRLGKSQEIPRSAVRDVGAPARDIAPARAPFR